jgi:glycerol-3-phosphate dehydrogenase
MSRASLIAEAQAVTHDSAVGEHLVHAYGTHWRAVWQSTYGEPSDALRIVDALPYTRAEIRYAVQQELACTLADVLVRRTHIAFETTDHGRGAARRIAPLMASLLGWNEHACTRAVAQYDADATRLFSIDP